MRAGWEGNLELQRRVLQEPKDARVIVEAATVQGEDVASRRDQWQQADSLAGLLLRPDGRVEINGSLNTLINQNIEDLTDNIGELNPVGSDNLFCGRVEWDLQGDINQRINRIKAFLDPAAGGAKQVAQWRCLLFAPVVVQGLNLFEVFTLQQIARRVDVPAGASAGEVTFDFEAGGPIPRAWRDPNHDRALTYVIIWGIDDTGALAGNVAWRTDSAISQHVGTAGTLTRRQLQRRDITDAAGPQYIDVTGPISGVPYLIVEASSFLAQTITFTGDPFNISQPDTLGTNVLTNPGAETGDLTGWDATFGDPFSVDDQAKVGDLSFRAFHPTEGGGLGPNLLSNGSAETGDLSGWDTTFVGQFTVDFAEAKIGERSFVADHGQTAQNSSISQVATSSVAVGDVFELSGWIKTDAMPSADGNGAFLIMTVPQAEAATLTVLERVGDVSPAENDMGRTVGILADDGAHDWTFVRLRCQVATAAPSQIAPFVAITGQRGKAWFDGMEFRKVDTSSPPTGSALFQTAFTNVTVGQVFELSGWIKTDAMPSVDGNGAFIVMQAPEGGTSTLTVLERVGDVSPAEDPEGRTVGILADDQPHDWTFVRLRCRVATANASTLDVAMSLGPGGIGQSGTAWFDGLRIYEVTEGGVPTNVVEFVGVGETPEDTSITYEVRNDADTAWVPFADGDTTEDLAGVGKRSSYEMRATLGPSSTGDVSPTLRGLGVREITRINLDGLAAVQDVRWAVDPINLRGEISEAVILLLREGVRDYRDPVSFLLAENDLADIEFRVWVGYGEEGSYATRAHWLLIDTFGVDDHEDTQAGVVVRCLSRLIKLRRALPKFDPETDGRETLVYTNQTLKAVYDDLLDGQVGLSPRFRGPGVENTAPENQVTKQITDSDGKTEIDAIAYLDGSAVISSQGTIKAVKMLELRPGDLPDSAQPLRGVFYAEETTPVRIGPGASYRSPEFFAPWDYRVEEDRFLEEVRSFNVDALVAFDIDALDRPRRLDNEIAKWIDTEEHAQRVADNHTEHFGSGFLSWRFRTLRAHPELEPGDLVAVETDRFIAKDPHAARALRGWAWALGVVQEVGNIWGTDLTIWIRSYADILSTAAPVKRESLPTLAERIINQIGSWTRTYSVSNAQPATLVDLLGQPLDPTIGVDYKVYMRNVETPNADNRGFASLHSTGGGFEFGAITGVGGPDYRPEVIIDAGVPKLRLRGGAFTHDVVVEIQKTVNAEDLWQGSEGNNQNLLDERAGLTIIQDQFFAYYDGDLETLGVEPGDIISFSAFVAVPNSDGNAGVAIRTFDNAGVSLQTEIRNVVASPGYQRVTLENFNIHPDTVRIDVRGAGAAGFTRWYNNAMLNRGPVALPYDDPPFRFRRDRLLPHQTRLDGDLYIPETNVPIVGTGPGGEGVRTKKLTFNVPELVGSSNAEQYIMSSTGNFVSPTATGPQFLRLPLPIPVGLLLTEIRMRLKRDLANGGNTAQFEFVVANDEDPLPTTLATLNGTLPSFTWHSSVLDELVVAENAYFGILTLDANPPTSAAAAGRLEITYEMHDYAESY